MPRFTSKLFTDLAVWMIALGVLVGASFPFFTLALGIGAAQVLTPQFWTATLTAGILLGTASYLLARLVVRPRLQLLGEHMRVVEKAIRDATYTNDWSGCTLERCRVSVDSEDELGESAKAFNDLVEALFRAREVSSAVSDFSRALSCQLELDALTTQALDLLLEHTGGLAGVVLIESAGELVISAHHGLRDPQALIASGHVRQALRTGECQKVEFPDDVHVEAVLADFRPREIMVIPVEFKKTPLGVVVLATSRVFTPDVEWLLQLFRQGFGLALNNALAHHQLQRMAALDPLTGAYNRRFGLTRVSEEFHRAARLKSSLGLVMADIDYFKFINDTYGHLAGDRVLSVVSDTIRRSLREGDVMVRFGGEEFLIALPGASAADTRRLAERLRGAISEMVVQDGDQQITTTLSLGVTSYPEDNIADLQRLIKRADDALYRAKEQGRDRVAEAIHRIEPDPNPPNADPLPDVSAAPS